MGEKILKNLKTYSQSIYLISVVLLILMYILRTSYNYPIKYASLFFNILRAIAFSLLCAKFLVDVCSGIYKMKEVFCIVLIGIYMLMISLQSKTFGYLIYYILIITSKNVNYLKVIKCVFISFVFTTGLILFLCYLGILEDHIFFEQTRYRHGLGFNWTTHFPIMFMYIVLYYIFIRRNKIIILEYLIILAINLFAFVMTKTKSSFVLTTLAITTAFIISKVKIFQVYYKPYKIAAIVFPILFSLFIVLISFYYNPNSFVLSKMNSILSGRLALGNSAINKYGFSLFARHIVFIGGEVTNSDIYNYVDSSFLLYLLNFGLIFYILLMALLIYFAKLINEKQDIYTLLIFIIIIIHSTFDPQLLNLCFNYFLIVWSYKNTKINVLISKKI